MRPSLTTACLVALTAFGLPAGSASQTMQYAYDAAGRLSVVADARGDVAVYDYDAVGNLLSIRRLTVGDLADPVAIAVVAPGAARPGATVSIFGKGFASAPPSNGVSFNGTTATVLAASATRLTVIVPPHATTGPIRVSAPRGSAMSPEPFRVLGDLSVAPATALLAPGGRMQFAAVTADGTPAAVRWSVDGLVGGNAAHGTIAPDGLYIAPADPVASVRVAAVSLDDAALEAAALVSVAAARPMFLVARSVAVDAAPTSHRAEVVVTASAAVAHALRADVTATASVAVSAGAAFAMAPPVTTHGTPVVTDVLPAVAARGETLQLRVEGAGFDGATRLEFLAGPDADAAVSVSTPVVSADGREAVVEIHIAADAAPGPRVVRIVTPGGGSDRAGLDGNVFTIH